MTDEKHKAEEQPQRKMNPWLVGCTGSVLLVSALFVGLIAFYNQALYGATAPTQQAPPADIAPTAAALWEDPTAHDERLIFLGRGVQTNEDGRVTVRQGTTVRMVIEIDSLDGVDILYLVDFPRPLATSINGERHQRQWQATNTQLRQSFVADLEPGL
ncbi:MAG: hypothetical protein AAF125_21440, partial [Chloroflexota bacterium]